MLTHTRPFQADAKPMRVNATQCEPVHTNENQIKIDATKYKLMQTVQINATPMHTARRTVGHMFVAGMPAIVDRKHIHAHQ